MKYLYILFLLISIQIVKSQDTTFNILNHSYPATSSIYAMDKLDSTYYLFIIQLDTPNYFQHVNYGIIKLNSKFEIIDSVLIDIDKTVIAPNGHGFEISNDSNILFCGTITEDHNQYNGYIAKFNKDLDTLWTKQIMHPDTAYADTAQTPWVVLRDIEITPDGNYIIVGNYNHHCQGNANRSFLLKMDTSGNILYFKKFEINEASKIIELEFNPLDSGYFFVSAINNEMKLVSLNKNLNVNWLINYINEPYPTIISGIKLIDSVLVIGSTFFLTPFNQSSNLILGVYAINIKTKSKIWEKTFPKINVLSKFLAQEVVDVEEMPNGNIAIGTVGMKYLDSTFYPDIRANILMLNSNGDSLWSHYYTYQNDSLDVEDMQFNDMVVCDDGGILFGGFYISNQDYITRPWLVKTDSLGNAPGMFTVGIEEDELVIKNYKFRIYPNPTSDIVNLSIEEIPKKDLQLEVYNMSGQLVMQQQLSSFENEHRVDVQYLQSGIYLIKLSSDNQVIFSDKFVKE